MRAAAIVNPSAGAGAERALGALREAPWRELEVHRTEAPGHGELLARRALERGAELLIAVGGDGTVNEVARPLLGGRGLLAVVPSGSGNGLARALRIPLRPRAALAALASAVPRRMDVGRLNGRPFLNVAGAGFDAEVGAAFHDNARDGGGRGLLNYVLLSLRRALRRRARRFEIERGGAALPGEALIVAFANSPQYGAGAVIAPRARLDDGHIDVVVFEDAPLPVLVAAAPRLFFGGIERYRGYHRQALASAVIRGEAPFHLDGEPEAEAGRFELGVEPRALAILVPRATAEDPDGPFGRAD